MASHVLSLLVLVMLSVWAPGSRAQDVVECVIEEPGVKIITVDEEFGCGILECYNQTVNASQYLQYNFVGWITPALTVLNVTYDDGRITVEESADSFTIQIRNITRHDIGLYHCMLQEVNTDEFFLIRLGLNVKGPFFTPLWEEYKMNTIVGCSAFGGFLVLTGLIYLIYYCRYEGEEEDEKADGLPVFTPQAFTSTGKPVLASVPSYVPSVESMNGGVLSTGDSPGELRKRNTYDNPYQAYENKAYTGDDNKPYTNLATDLKDDKVNEFFSAAPAKAEPKEEVVTTEL